MSIFQFSQFMSILSCLINLCPYCPFLLIYVHNVVYNTFTSILSYLINLCPFRHIYSIYVHFIIFDQFTSILSYLINLRPMYSFLTYLRPFFLSIQFCHFALINELMSICRIQSIYVHFIDFGPLCSTNQFTSISSNFEQFSQQTSRLVLAIGTLMVFVVFRSKTLTNSPKRPSLHKITLDMFDSLYRLRDSGSVG